MRMKRGIREGLGKKLICSGSEGAAAGYQAVSYFYGYTKLLSLRKDAESALGPKFNQLRFHDFVLRQGLLPPSLLRKAVLEDFMPSQL
jgi:uncharacterized protein (DUF885 family)